MNVVQRLRDRYAGLVEVAHELFKEGEAERVVDVMDAMERIEKEEIPRARAQTHQERKAANAARRADPDRQPVRLPEDLMGGFTEDPVHRRSLPQSVLDRIDQQDESARIQADREAREAGLRSRFRVERWRGNVLMGLADPRQVPDFEAEDHLAAGNVTVEELEAAIHERRADFLEIQRGADQQLEHAAMEYGRMCVEAFGPDGHQALAALLEGDSGRVPARHGRERGWA